MKLNHTLTKKNASSEVNPRSVCPHCGNRLMSMDSGHTYRYDARYATTCTKCRAMRIPSGCPSCGGDSWMASDTTFKHQMHDCGFVGKRKDFKGEKNDKRSAKAFLGR